MEKKNIGNKLALYPSLVSVIGAIAQEGKPTWTLVAHMGILGHDRVLVSLAHNHFINTYAKEQGVISINIVDEDWLAAATKSGTISGNKQDKSDMFAWSVGKDGSPIADDAKLTMECRIEDIYETPGFDNFICVVSNTYAAQAILNESDKPNYDVFKPALFEMPNYTYLSTGAELGACLSFAKK